jgi:aspartyl/asparaginyl beta-hydroxylase (cupin superfamily)
MRKSVGQAPTAGEQTQQKPCRTSSDIGAEQFNVGWERVKNPPTINNCVINWRTKPNLNMKNLNFTVARNKHHASCR